MKKHKKIYKILLMVLVISLMTGCETIENLDFNQACLQCGDEITFPAYLVKLCANIVQFVQVMVPVIIIVVGMIDLFKAVIASDEKKMTESKDSVIRKVVAGVMIFLIIAVVRFAFTAIPDFDDGDVDAMECLSYFMNGDFSEVSCPQRIDGNPQSVEDREEGIDIDVQEIVDRIRRTGTYTECRNITSREACLSSSDEIDCEWNSSHNPHCLPAGYMSSESQWGCYVNQAQPVGSRQRLWVKQSPGNSWVLESRDPDGCIDDKFKGCQSIKKAEVCNAQDDCEYKNGSCVAKGSEKIEKACYICKINNNKYYTWGPAGMSDCDSTPVEGKNSKQECEKGKVPTNENSETSKLCWDCYHADTKEHRYYFMEKAPDDEKKNKCTSSKISEAECSKKSGVVIVDE